MRIRVLGRLVQKLMSESPEIVPELHESHPSIGLQDLVALRHLTLEIGQMGWLESAINMLESGLGVPPKLEELNILYVHWGDVVTEAMDGMGVTRIFGEHLQLDDEKFGSMYTSGKFPCLKRINIMLAVLVFLMDDNTMELHLRSCLPFIHGTGMLVVKVGRPNDVGRFIKDASIVPRVGEYR